MFKEMMEDMEETERYHKMMWLVEATYGDYAFYPARDFDNVVALTLKDIPDSSQFVFIFPNEKNKEKIAFLESVWEVNWVSLLPLALDKSMRFLMQIAVSATLQVPDELLSPGIWCKSKEMETKLSVFIPSTERGGRNRRVSCRESSGLRGEDEEDEREGSPAPYDERIHREHERHYSLLLYACEAATVLALY